MKHTSDESVPGYFEPELIHTFLPGCRNCGSAHPLALKPVPVDTETCPVCQSPVLAPGESHVESAVLTNRPGNLFAKFCLGAGKALTKLSKRI